VHDERWDLTLMLDDEERAAPADAELDEHEDVTEPEDFDADEWGTHDAGSGPSPSDEEHILARMVGHGRRENGERAEGDDLLDDVGFDDVGFDDE
jgi:hypothetical protein